MDKYKKIICIVFCLLLSFVVFAQNQLYPIDELYGVRLRHSRVNGRITSTRGRISAVKFSPDSNILYYGGSDGVAYSWNRTEDTLSEMYTRNNYTISSYEITQDGKRIILTVGQEVWYWNVESNEITGRGSALDQGVYSSAFIPNSNLAVSVGQSSDSINSTSIWPLERGRHIARLIGHTDTVIDVEVTSDGRYAITGSRDSTVRLWDLESYEEIRQYSFNPVGGSDQWGVTNIDLSQDEKYILASGSAPEIVIFNRETGAVHNTIPLDGERVSESFFLANDSLIMSREYSEPNTIIRIRDTDTGVVVMEFLGSEGGLLYASDLSPDQTLAAAGGEANLVYLWEMPALGYLERLRAGRVYSHESARRSGRVRFME